MPGAYLARAQTQALSTSAPPAETQPAELPDSPGYPDATPIGPAADAAHAVLTADYKRLAQGHLTLEGHVHLEYMNRSAAADHAEYDEATGETTLAGNVLVTGGGNDEILHASHAEINLRDGTGRFYDVTGSVGVKPPAPGRTEEVYTNGNPFRFTGREVVKSGPETYTIYEGTLTSCQLPRPDWVFSAGKFEVDDTTARARNSVFRLVNVPVLYLPYVTHSRAAQGRQSGFLIPVVGDSSSKGLTFGEQIYWAINRSTDLTVGTIYYSRRGWSRTARFQYKGLGDDFVRAHYSALADRGYTPTGGVYTNQSGTDLTFSARRDVLPDAPDPGKPVQTRLVADVEYLSSFVYREAFTDNFNQAVSSDVNSTVYAVHEANGLATSLEGDRYQGEKRLAQFNRAGVFLPEQQVHIFHAPALEFYATDHHLGQTPIEWNLSSSVAALKRNQTNFVTSGMIERLDLRPELALPFSLGGLRVRPSVAARETFYSRSRMPGPNPPVESTSPANRASAEVEVDVRPPTIERTFDTGWLPRLLRHDVKHSIRAEITYRYVGGVGNFSNLLRFDTVDVLSDTNEVEYGVTQRLFLRPNSSRPCRSAQAYAGAANANEVLGATEAEADDNAEGGDVSAQAAPVEGATVCGTREWISWRIAQKYFFDPSFGNAVSTGPRSVLDTTLNFTGIAFVTRPRSISPVVSRLRIRTSEKTDIEWDADYDLCAPPLPSGPPVPSTACDSRFTSSNVFFDIHQGPAFGGLSYAWLDAPAVAYVDGVRSPIAQFDQIRLLAGFGRPTRRGLSAAANVGLDLNLATVQYGSLQTSYNWNCCGLSVEYRKYELGSARNENAYRFNFTLANIGTAGNLRRNQQVF